MKSTLGCLVMLMALVMSVCGQDPASTTPEIGLRENLPAGFALTGAKVYRQPGDQLPEATILIDRTAIVAVGPDVVIPAGYRVIDCSGRTIYPGLIDAWGEVDLAIPATADGAGYWNRHISPQRRAAVQAGTVASEEAKLRGQGVGARVLAPRGGIIRGRSATVLLHDHPERSGDAISAARGRRVLQENAWQHVALTVPEDRLGERYPNSPMGAVALVRQAFFDAQWYQSAWQAFRANASLPRPETNDALQALQATLADDLVVMDAPNERMALRAAAIASEFSCAAIIRGSGREYRELTDIAATQLPILLPVHFPDPPELQTAADAREVTLQTLLHWELAPTNPARLDEAGVTFCITSDGLPDPANLLKQVRYAVKRGLSAETALAAMTVRPAKLLNLEHQLGKVMPGMLANLVITDGSLFDDQTKVRETWIAGHRYVIEQPESLVDALEGAYRINGRIGRFRLNVDLELRKDADKWSGELKARDDKQTRANLRQIARHADRLTATVALDRWDDSLPGGLTRVTFLVVPGATPQQTSDLFVTLDLPDGQQVTLDCKPLPPSAVDSADKSPEASTPEPIEATASEDAQERAVDHDTLVPIPMMRPLGSYGLTQRPSQPDCVLFQGATVWTCGEAGILSPADVFVRKGRVAAVGVDLPVPADVQVISLSGQHLTPGIIDCHSHMATDGGVNESGQVITAEVRVGDFLDHSDITIYRHLAGGVTVANLLHGSANPIGGQNQVVKLRWGAGMGDLPMREAPAGIKFALGENVKRNSSRYPNSRMGVQQLLRDQFLAAREYLARQQRWRAGERSELPPRIDLQAEAVAEVLKGERLIHCHSYRQDEILATLKLLAEFNVQIGTLQHILEGYKVADEMHQYGAMGSSFADWWAYKFEVFDAIPYNGALMHDRGVVVSFNSDDRELARHLNTEAAKAVKYGGVPAEEALKFVTLNPAIQLRIDQHVGSIEVGKHADLVVWSGPPLSTTSRCEQTWVDGVRYFDRQLSQELLERDQALHARLVRKVLRLHADGSPEVTANRNGDRSRENVAEEDRWLRYDAFCTANGDRQRSAAQRGEFEQRDVNLQEESTDAY